MPVNTRMANATTSTPDAGQAGRELTFPRLASRMEALPQDKGLSMRLPALLLLAVSSQTTFAEIYMCEENGRKTFSQQPCGKDAKNIVVEKKAGAFALPDELDGAAAGQLCNVIVNSWDVATQMKRNRVDLGEARQRVFGYVREHISNFDERLNRDPDLYRRLQTVTSRLTLDAYSSGNMSSDERQAALNACITQLQNRINSTPKGKHPTVRPAQMM